MFPYVFLTLKFIITICPVLCVTNVFFRMRYISTGVGHIPSLSFMFTRRFPWLLPPLTLFHAVRFIYAPRDVVLHLWNFYFQLFYPLVARRMCRECSFWKDALIWPENEETEQFMIAAKLLSKTDVLRRKHCIVQNAK